MYSEVDQTIEFYKLSFLRYKVCTATLPKFLVDRWRITSIPTSGWLPWKIDLALLLPPSGVTARQVLFFLKGSKSALEKRENSGRPIGYRCIMLTGIGKLVWKSTCKWSPCSRTGFGICHVHFWSCFPWKTELSLDRQSLCNFLWKELSSCWKVLTSSLLFHPERILSLRFTTAKLFQQVLIPRAFIQVRSISAELSSCFPFVFPKTIVQNMSIQKPTRHSTP